MVSESIWTELKVWGWIRREDPVFSTDTANKLWQFTITSQQFEETQLLKSNPSCAYWLCSTPPRAESRGTYARPRARGQPGVCGGTGCRYAGRSNSSSRSCVPPSKRGCRRTPDQRRARASQGPQWPVCPSRPRHTTSGSAWSCPQRGPRRCWASLAEARMRPREERHTGECPG